MKNKYISLLVLSLYILPIKSEIIDLKKMTELVLENNFDIKIAKSKELEKLGAFRQSKGGFDFGMSYDFNYADSDTPSSSSLDGGGSASSVKSSEINHSLTLSKSFGTGTEISLPYNWVINDSTSSFKIFPKSHQSSLGVNISQPLLRVFSRGYFTKALDNAQLDYLVERAKSDAKIEDGLKKAVESFFDVYEMNKASEISLNSLLTARDNYDFIMARRKIGLSSLIEVLDAESSYKKSIERQLKDKNKFKKAKGKLSILIYGKHDVEFSPANINIEDFKITIPSKEQRQELVKKAIAHRRETFSRLKSLEKATNTFNQSKTDLLPTVDLDYTYTSSGLSDKQDKANQEVFDRKFITTKVGLTVARDVFRYAAKGSYHTNKLKAAQEKLKYDQHLQDVGLEIHSVIADIESQEAVVEAVRASVAAQRLKLKYRQKQFKQGKLSSFELDKQIESKEKSELQLARAEMSYLKKIFSFHHAKGELSERLVRGPSSQH